MNERTRTRTHPVIKILKQARKLVNKGWVQGRMVKRTKSGNSYCVLGAIDKAATLNHGALLEYMSPTLRCISHNTDNIIMYNDAPKRTKKQVLALFDRAISRAEVLDQKGHLQ